MIDYPEIVQIFIGDICNLRCSFCVPRQEAWSKGKKWVMLDQVDKDISTDLLDKISPIFREAKCLYLTGGGEPLATKAFWSFIDGKRFSNSISFNTNGTLLSEKNVERLLSYKKTMHVSISINAASREVYKKIVGEDFFDEIINGAVRLKNAAETRGVDIRITYSMVVVKDNLHEMSEFINLVAKLKGNSATIQFGIFPYQYEWPLNNSFKSNNQNISSSPQLLELYNSNFFEAEALANSLDIKLSGRGGDDTQYEGFCTELFDFMRIEQNGDTSACCHVWGIKTGKVNDHSDVLSLWNSEKRVSMRSSVLSGNFPTECQSPDCGFYRNAIYRKLNNLAPIKSFSDQKYMGYSAEIELSIDNNANNSNTTSEILINAKITNNGNKTWEAQSSEMPVIFGGRLFKDGNIAASIDEYRTPIPKNIAPGETFNLKMLCKLNNATQGKHFISLNMLIEGQRWFQDIGNTDYRISFDL